MLAKPLAVTSAHRYYIHILIVRIPLGKLSCWLSSHNRASRDCGAKRDCGSFPLIFPLIQAGCVIDAWSPMLYQRRSNRRRRFLLQEVRHVAAKPHPRTSGYSTGSPGRAWPTSSTACQNFLCKWVRRLPQHALTTCYCCSCSLQLHLDWLYSSDVRAQPSTAKGNWHAPRERRDY